MFVRGKLALLQIDFACHTKTVCKSYLCAASSAATNDGNKFTARTGQRTGRNSADFQLPTAKSSVQKYCKQLVVGHSSSRERDGEGEKGRAHNFWLLLTPGQYAVNLPECASRFGNAAVADDDDEAGTGRAPATWLLEMGYIFYA